MVIKWGEDVPCSLCDVYITSHSQFEHDKRGLKYKNKNTEFRTIACDCGLTVPGSANNSGFCF